MTFEINVLIDSEQPRNVIIQNILEMVNFTYLASWNSFASYFYDQVRPEAVQALY